MMKDMWRTSYAYVHVLLRLTGPIYTYIWRFLICYGSQPPPIKPSKINAKYDSIAYIGPFFHVDSDSDVKSSRLYIKLYSFIDFSVV